MLKGHLFLVWVLSLAACASAQPSDLGPPVGPEDAKIRIGEFLATFTEKSPDSTIAKIDRRMGLKPAQPVADYDLSKEIFDVYVPRAPAANGYYGVMVSMCFTGHQWPTATWKPVLNQYHLIWIGVTIVNDPRPVEQHAGLLLDAAYNIRKQWTTDPNRMYLATNTGERPISGMAFYYPDVFNGTILSPSLSWFLKIKDPDPKVGTWSTDNMVRPQSADWDRAKSKSRFFIALNDSTDEDAVRCDDLIVHMGFKAGGFKHFKFVRIKPVEMGRYTDWYSNWFEQGIQFLDDGATPPASQAVVTARADPTKANGALDMAKNYMVMGKTDEARSRLKQIIDTYPDTAAAREAAKLIKQIPVK